MTRKEKGIKRFPRCAAEGATTRKFYQSRAFPQLTRSKRKIKTFFGRGGGKRSKPSDKRGRIQAQETSLQRGGGEEKRRKTVTSYCRKNRFFSIRGKYRDKSMASVNPREEERDELPDRFLPKKRGHANRKEALIHWKRRIYTAGRGGGGKKKEKTCANSTNVIGINLVA